MVFSGFTFAFVFHLVFAHPTGRTRSTLLRSAIWLVYVETFVAALGLAVFRDPYFDPGCLANCNVNVFLVRSLPSLAQTIVEVDRWFVVAAAIALIGICLARLATGSRPARRELAPVVVPGTLFAATVAVRAVDLHRVTVEEPFNDVLFATFILAGVALTLLAAGLIATVVRAWLQRRAVLRIATELDEAPAPGSVRAALADALGDPQLGVAYPLANGARYVDADGRPIDEPVADGGQTITTLVNCGRTIAIISHATTVTDLGSQIGPAALLALENERLQAELLAELEELRASRMRIVETGDAERRRLERDLHDGAQQRLLALSYDIRLAKAAAEAAGDAAAGSLLTRATEETQGALEDLRGIAHGIYPAVLEEAGLGPALETLADTASVAVGIRADGRRYPGAVEAAAYFAAAETLDDATGRGAQRVTISCGARHGRLILTVEDDGSDASNVDDGRHRPGGRARRRGHVRSHDMQGGDPVRVVVAEDVMLTREGIVRLLQDADVEVVGQASDADELMRQVGFTDPDVAIIDIRMPPTHTDEGLVAAQRIRAQYPETGVLVLSQYVEPSYAMRLIEDHPERVGYLLKERIFDIAVVVDALRRIGDAEAVIDPTIVSRLVGRRRESDPLEALTVREHEVLGLIAEGMSNKAIATRLSVTNRTVEAHITQIFLKLGLAESADQHRRVLAVLTLLRG
jgi:DNA-binding NarL/FixJ family response regulator/signal transduction histidine kinase